MATGDVLDRLWRARQDGDYAPAWLVGQLDLQGALDLQLGLLARAEEGGETQSGWKVGLTSARARQAVGVDERPFGYLLSSRTLASGSTIDSAALHHPSIEIEMCFTIGADGAPERVAAGFEINERRPGSARPDFGVMVTDCLTNWGIVEGSGVSPVPSAADLSGTVIRLERNGEEVFADRSDAHVDDHMVSLARLSEQLGRHGRRLEHGQKVITGAFARFDTEAGDDWRAVYEGIGEVEVHIR
jgi:2-keto-4-pentenoate hydratase